MPIRYVRDHNHAVVDDDGWRLERVKTTRDAAHKMHMTHVSGDEVTYWSVEFWGDEFGEQITGIVHVKAGEVIAPSTMYRVPTDATERREMEERIVELATALYRGRRGLPPEFPVKIVIGKPPIDDPLA